MTLPEQELADEQLDALLNEIGISSPSETTDNEPSLEKLLDEVFDLSELPSPSPALPTLPTLPLREEKKRRSKSMVWVTVTLFLGLLAGSTFGYFWGQSQGIMDTPIVEPQEEITTQISYWIKELKELYEAVEPPPAEEIIEPLETPGEMESLAPTEMA